jgi:hypothetical protein
MARVRMTNSETLKRIKSVLGVQGNYQVYIAVRSAVGIDPKRIKSVRMQDVADDAGYSLQAVSHVLNGNYAHQYTAEARERIKASANRLGYQYVPRKTRKDAVRKGGVTS